MRLIRETARKNKIYVSLGYSELDLASLYMAQVLISPSGDILNHRRKIRATHVERLVFGDGTGDTTESVVQTDIGRIGQLYVYPPTTTAPTGTTTTATTAAPFL